MSIKTILVPIDGTEVSRTALDAALLLGRDLAAHVDVLHVATDPKDAVPLLGEGMSAAIIEEMIQLAEREATERTARAEAMFEDARARFELATQASPPAGENGSALLVKTTGREDVLCAEKGRLVDMVVTARPTEQSDASLAMTINAAIFETGRPVLIAPPHLPETIGKKIAISWNGSAEASCAVAAAIPLITRAESVTVLTAENDKTSSAVAAELVAYLAWHGVSADSRNLPGGSQVGEVLLEDCKSIGADLLVMGAYTHSRMRQLILGGVTKHVLANAGLPVLMAH
ncbi:MAG: universal stress protein [Rhodospirillaceae bacterium]|jgi:nucleotide-binding universal stress UspA family protein|nr:universal stress protein [Rhodospirillaceae bacterium]MBT5244151.1 universal stress protein [Rhodospirillaceae bacterium]MBT5561676.1 universal stress protein [Rhodospirillaceae bacterium]MBT6243115.1 universal stress protein [Rhodospirillaceae bacterium]